MTRSRNSLDKGKASFRPFYLVTLMADVGREN
jgi:hypothetical protein